MALDAVRDGVGPRFPIEIRLSGDDMTENGLHLEDYIKVAQMVDDKVDLFNISAGDHEDPALFCRTHPSAFYPHGANVYLAAEIKKHVKKPVACVGSLNDPAQMEEIIATGKADIVELARALLADPYLPQKASKGQADDITPCLRCFECFGETTKTDHIRCTVNPRMGQQFWEKTPRETAEHRKRILVAGGGPAGMEAAITMAKRGHDVTLAEKSGQLGGNLIPAGAPYFKQDIVEFLAVLVKRVKESEIKIILNTEVTEDYLKKFSPDVFFIAIGSSEIVPPVKGINGNNVITAIDAELHPEKLGKRVAILGGGLVGAEAAVSFYHEGKECTVIEMKNEIAGEVSPLYRGGLMPEVQKAAKIHTNTTVKEILPQGLVCDGGEGEFIVEADTVVIAAGFRSPYETVDRLCSLAGEYHILGDCKNVGQIYHAINTAYYAALSV
jgi:NADPH-dependent 2,4-dienoyl-CoA reductase/sulfur reductase-like enzyme